jgi:alpha-glucoside transport system substrate-binding protein
MRKSWVRLLAVPFSLALVAAACSTSDDDDDAGGDASVETPSATGGETTAAPTGGTTAETEGTTEGTTEGSGASAASTTFPEAPGAGSAGEVTIFGVENSETEAGAMQDALASFGEANGITITYVGARDFEQQINSQVLGGNPPDIAVFPQPGKVKQFAEDGTVLPVPDDVLTAVSENWDQSWLDFTNVDGTQYGVPNKSDLKSLVWYVPSAFTEKGYDVPETLTDFKALVDEMIANGDTPLCVGIESGPATGWPFTDWVEELILREQGIDYYNQWVTHEVPFNDQPVIDTFNEVAGPDGFWTKQGAVFAVGGSIAATAFGDNAEPLLAGDCMMHRQASFYASFFPEGTTFGPEGDANYFYFPADEGKPVLVGGTSAAAFRDAPEVWQVMEYLGSAEFADARQEAQSARQGGGDASGYLSANLNADPALYTELEQGFLEILKSADPAAFDGSDNMPADVGSGTFWTEGTSFVNGDEDAQTATDNIEASWPS